MFFSRATLNEAFTVKYDGVFLRTPWVRPTSEIYAPKQDDEHPHSFHMRSPPRASNINCSTVVFIFHVCRLSKPVCSKLNYVQTRQVDNEVINNVHSSTHLRECYSSEYWYTCRDRDGTARAKTRGRALLKVSGKRLYTMEACSHCQSKISDCDEWCDWDWCYDCASDVTVTGTMIVLTIYFMDLLSQKSLTAHYR